MARFASRSVSLFFMAATLIPLTASAQAASFASGRAIGVTVQAIKHSEGVLEIPAVALHVTSIRPSMFGVDVTVATLPTALAQGFLILAPDVGVARLFPFGSSAFMLKGGLSGIITAAGGGAVGFHLGAAVLLGTADGVGIRAEVIPRFYGFEGGGFHFTTLGIGLTSLPSRSR